MLTVLFTVADQIKMLSVKEPCIQGHPTLYSEDAIMDNDHCAIMFQ